MDEKADCLSTRILLQEAHDRHCAAGPDVTRHLLQCDTCRAFRLFLEQTGTDLRAALDAAGCSTTRVDFGALLEERRRRARARGFISSLAAAAAVLVILVGSLFTVSTVNRQREHQLVREETNTFVDTLFETPLFDGIEYVAVGEDGE